MKKIILLIVVLAFTHIKSNAQTSKNNTIYINNGFSIGNYYGLNIDINYIYKEKHTVAFGYSGIIRKPKSQPKDYTGGLAGLFTFNLAAPHDEILYYKLLVGKIKKLNKHARILLNLKGGIAYAKILTATNWQSTGTGFVGSNYSFEYKKNNALFVVLNPEILFLGHSKKMGTSISPFVLINNKDFAFGIGLNFIFGFMDFKSKTVLKN